MSKFTKNSKTNRIESINNNLNKKFIKRLIIILCKKKSHQIKFNKYSKNLSNKKINS